MYCLSVTMGMHWIHLSPNPNTNPKNSNLNPRLSPFCELEKCFHTLYWKIWFIKINNFITGTTIHMHVFINSCCSLLLSIMNTCGICLNPTFNQPAGCLTRMLLCDNRTEKSPHALCWECVFKIGNINESDDICRLKCPYCRESCVFNFSDLPDTGSMNIGLCETCGGFMDSFGPRMQYNQNMCLRCHLKTGKEHKIHETYVGNYEQMKTPNILKIQGTKYRLENNRIKTYFYNNDAHYYCGEWKGSCRHGQGVFVCADGERYEGSYKDDKMHGQGVRVWADGYAGIIEYIPPHLMTETVCLKIIEQNTRFIRYIPKNRRTFAVCARALNTTNFPEYVKLFVPKEHKTAILAAPQ
jgi:hypothetical protein